MGKIKRAVRNMSLKKSLLSMGVLCLGTVSILVIATVLIFSDIRQKILDTRPIHISDYSVETEGDEGSGGMLIVPYVHTFGELSGKSRIYYRAATVCMAVLPVLYVIAGAFLMTKWYYRLKIQKPLEELKKGMEYIARQDLDFQMEYHTEDELGKLCDTFEVMKNEIHRSNRGMWELLQERKALTASISHDLRTPLTVINGYLDYLEKAAEKGTVTDELLQSTVQSMAGAAQRLERYVDCVKDVQKMEDIEIRTERFLLKDYINGMETDYGLLAEKQGKCLEIRDLTRTDYIETDRDMLSKAMENIFNNALRFSVQNIRIIIEETEKEFLFTIEDDGTGFTREELRSATSLFYSSPENRGSFGIGLSICSILCGKFGGILKLDNVPGGGARVSISIEKKHTFSEI